MSITREQKFHTLRRHLKDQIDIIHNFLHELSDPDNEDTSTVYKFQSLMEGLIPLKINADDLTRTLDHG